MPKIAKISRGTDAHALAAQLRVSIGQLRRRMREQAQPGEFSASQKAVVLRLESGGAATVTTLARAEGMRPQSMGAIVAALASAGLVRGKSDPADGRQTLWSLTSDCREWIKAGRAAREDWLYRSIQNTLTPAEQALLANALVLLERLIDA